MFICSVQPGAPLVSGTCAVLGFAGMVVKVSGYVPVDSVGALGAVLGPEVYVVHLMAGGHKWEVAFPSGMGAVRGVAVPWSGGPGSSRCL